MIDFDLDFLDYEKIWTAPEGNDYAVQYQRDGDRRWTTGELALTLTEARQIYANMVDNSAPATKVRLVTLSRYPPCCANKVIKYQEVE